MSENKAAGVVAEFNPFHKGHEYLLKEVRNAGFSEIAVVMSGNFTQRGEAACALKEARVRAALLCGADLVVELPLPFAISSAERFSYAAVSILNSLGCLDSLVFGSETADTIALCDCAKKLNGLDGSPLLAQKLKEGSSFVKARADALKEICSNSCGNSCGESYEKILSNPNDTLGIEYIKALSKLGSSMKPHAVKRRGAGHDDEGADGETASASAIRELLLYGKTEKALSFLPAESAKIMRGEIEAGRAPYKSDKASLLMLDRLRRMSKEDFLNLPDVSEGLENRLFAAARSAVSLDGFLGEVKSKRYTLARIRRIALCAYLGVTKEYAASEPPYVRVLGFNSRGLKLLTKAKKSAQKPIFSRYSDFKSADALSKDFFELECRASDLYCLGLPTVLPCGSEEKFMTLRVSD